MNRETENTTWKNWGKILLGLLIIYLLVFWIAPLLERVPWIADVHQYTQAHNIDATALVYTEIDEFADADVSIRDAMKY